MNVQLLCIAKSMKVTVYTLIFHFIAKCMNVPVYTLIFHFSDFMNKLYLALHTFTFIIKNYIF